MELSVALLASTAGAAFVYNGVAAQKGLPKGTFFASGKANLLSSVALLFSLFFGFKAGSFLGVILALIAFFVGGRILITLFGKHSQMLSLLGMIATFIWCSLTI